MRGVRGAQGVGSCRGASSVGTCLIGRNGELHTPRGTVRSADEAIRFGMLPVYVQAQQIAAQRDLPLEGWGA
jgi:hypothetical protein